MHLVTCGRSAKGLRSPVGKGTPGSGRALGSGRTLAGDAIVTLGTLHDSYTAMMHKVSSLQLHMVNGVEYI